MFRYLSLQLLVAGVLLGACAGDLDQPERFAKGADGGGSDASPSPGLDAGGGGSDAAPSCVDVPSTIFTASCAGASCHNAKDKASGLDLVSPGLASRVLGKPAQGGGGMLVDHDHPELSVIYAKLTATPPSGSRMPLGAPLDDAATACVLAWAKSLAP